ncbi:brain mitochondrial carrier protein 1 [Sparus aurata]|uniref:brain mitochondrial carrier protein 1 n=1 Tax=Sparus aurata TaxID=8175 RepID=UPI0011C0EFD5|nr:kidney mitochondrial carrier protein 1-like [Sparus aurata]
MFPDMLYCLRLQHCVDLCLWTLLFVAGLQQVEAAAAEEMASLNWKPFIYGGMASIVAEFGTFPIDLTKTRLQVQGQSQYTEVRYRGMFHALFRIGKEEGVRALYSGISPALLRQASYGTIKIGTYNSLKRLFVTRPEVGDLSVPLLLFGLDTSLLPQTAQTGFISSSSTMTHMLLVFTCRHGGKGVHIILIICCYYLIRLFSQRAAIVVGVELPVYDITKKHLLRSGVMGDTILTHFISSFTCGLAGALASNPVDVVRTRMMNQRVMTGGPMYKGTLDGLMQTWKNEGFFALYKGFWPNWLRLGPWNIIFFITFEQLKKLPF